MMASVTLLIVSCILIQPCISAELKFKPQSQGGESAEENAEGVHWALIVAGSKEYDNYRHQADACHAYHIIKKHGIPEERIILMMYDDIAFNTENPTKGIIINHPNGPNVYEGVKIDYKAETVTPENFLAVLSGNATKMSNVGSGKVINSGPNDHIFVNFVDHGAPGLIAFPESELLYATQLIKTIKDMYQAKKYGQLLFYIEACESGSMFQGLLPKNINVYATTAANSEESSYACYWDSERQTYLGDVYSVMWMEDSDKENLNMETLHKQFMIVKQETNTSHVQEFGDTKISQESVNNFQGGSTDIEVEPVILPKVPLDAVASEDVPLSILYRRLDLTNDLEKQQTIKNKIKDLIELKDRVFETMKSIVSLASRDHRQSSRIMTTKYRLTAHDCYEPIVQLFDERCFDISQNGYARKSLHQLVNLCEEQVAVETILESIAKTCRPSKK